MSTFDRHPRMRWALPAGTVALLLVGAAVGPGAAADDPLPPRTAEQLLVDLQTSEVPPLSGVVRTTVDLGLPALPMGGQDGPAGLASGSHTIRVWSDGPARTRLALLGDATETVWARDGDTAWLWSSSDASAVQYDLAGVTSPHDRVGNDALGVPETPQEAAELALAALDPTTEVTTSGAATVAGRAAHELVLTPRDPDTLVERVSIAVDAETGLALRVRVDSTRIDDPALQVAFSELDLGTPDAATFTFTPPPGATVEHRSAADAPVEGMLAGDGTGPIGAEPTVVGSGWSAVAVADLPDTVPADAQSADATPGDSGAAGPEESAMALVAALPQVSGSWGSGHVLAGTIFSAVLTDDGRIAAGMVPPQVLFDALAQG